MRAAALLSAAMIAIGAYVMIAATLNLAPTAIAGGVLGIALTTAVVIVGTGPRSAPSR